MTTDAPFGSRHSDWHPMDQPEYLTAAIGRVRAACGLADTTETANMALTIAQTTQDAPNGTQMGTESLTMHTTLTRENTTPYASLDRAALLARFWTIRPRPGELGSAEREAKQDRALALRREGFSYFQIAVELGYGCDDTAYQDVQRAMQREAVQDAA